jgi:hypothetical protein
MFYPALKFRFEATCRGVPDGPTVMYPVEVGSAAVTFRRTAATPVAGTPAVNAVLIPGIVGAEYSQPAAPH